jgi:hypothetical protein
MIKTSIGKWLKPLLNKIPTQTTIALAVLGGAFKLGMYYQETKMIREENKADALENEKLYLLRKEIIDLKGECNQLKLENKELNFQIKHNNEGTR